MAKISDAGKAAAILGGFCIFEGVFVAWYLWGGVGRFLRWMGFLPGRHTAASAGWVAALIVAAAYVAVSAARLPSVRANLLRPSWLKLLALATAVLAGILEEVVFRMLLMDAARDRGLNAALQVLLTGLAFGLMHGVWALFRGSWRAGFGAILATGSMGAALGVVYLAAGRSVAPCVVAHFLINLMVEPGLVLAAVRGEMGGAGLAAKAGS